MPKAESCDVRNITPAPIDYEQALSFYENGLISLEILQQQKPLPPMSNGEAVVLFAAMPIRRVQEQIQDAVVFAKSVIVGRFGIQENVITPNGEEIA